MPRIARVARGVAPPLVCCYLAPRSVGPPSRPSGCYSNDLWGRVEAGGRRTAGGGWLVVRALHATALLHDVHAICLCVLQCVLAASWRLSRGFPCNKAGQRRMTNFEPLFVFVFRAPANIFIFAPLPHSLLGPLLVRRAAPTHLRLYASFYL